MFRKQIKRVRENILPFVYIGMFIGIVIGKASLFRRIDWLNDYLLYAKIDTYYPDSGQIVFFIAATLSSRARPAPVITIKRHVPGLHCDSCATIFPESSPNTGTSQWCR